MKVLMINSVCGIRSTGRICTDIADILSINGDECMVAFGREKAPEQYQSISVKIGTELSVRLHGLLSRMFGYTGFYSARSTKRFLKWVENYQPDVIHLHNLHGYYIHIGELFRYLKKRQIPVVWTLHDCWGYTGHCPHFVEEGCEQWKTKCTHCQKTRTYPACWTHENVARNFDRKRSTMTGVSNMMLVTPSEWMAGLTRESFLKEYPVEVIHNGLDRSVFQPTEGDFREKHHLENKQIVLGVASVWSESKGLADFERLAERLPDTVQVVLVGLTKKQMMGMPEQILCIERTDSAKELAQIYTAADVFVNPSRAESMGMVTAEALACGTPCVVYDAAAIPEVIDQECGLTVPVGDVQALEEAVLRILQDKPFSKEDCCKRAADFDKTEQFGKYVELYRRVLRSARVDG